MPDLRHDHGCNACGTDTERPTRLAGRDRLHDRRDRVEVAVCAECASGTTHPRLAPEELGALYPDTYGPFSDAEGRVTAALSRMVRRVQGRLALRRFPLVALAALVPGRGLDVGCGRGDLAAWLIAAGWSMVGVEPSASACAAARAHGVDARQGTLVDVTLEPAAYDLVVFQHSLEHTADPRGDLDRVRTALAPGGMMIVTVPNFGSWQARRFHDRWYHLDLPRHRTHFTGQGLEELLAQAGLRVERLATSTSSVGLPATLQYAVAGRCLFPSGLGLRVVSGLCVLALPLARLADRLGGGGDQLHAIARHAPQRAPA